MYLHPVIIQENDGSFGLPTIYTQIGHNLLLAALANQEVIVTGSVMAVPTTTE